MKTFKLTLGAFLITPVAAQINFSSLLSQAESIVSSVFGDTSSTSSATSQTSSRTTPSSSTSRTTTSVSSSSTFASGASASPSPTTSAAAQSTASPSTIPSSSIAASTNTGTGSGGNSNTLPIVLGCTLGALALAAFLALLFFCRRRRNKRSGSPAKHRAPSSSDDDSDVWNREKSERNSFKGPTERTRSLGLTNNTVAAPLMSHHNRNTRHPHGTYDETTFAPVSDPSGQAKTHTDQMNTDSNTCSPHPYSPDHVRPYTDNSETRDHGDKHGDDIDFLAAGVGGAALGGLVNHAANKENRRRSESRSCKRVPGRSDPTFCENEPNTLPETAVEPGGRRLGSGSQASLREPWPFMDAQEQGSMDSSRSRPRSTSLSHDRFATPEQHPQDKHSMPSGAVLAGGAAAGGLVGAAAVRKAGSRSPHQKGILKQTVSDSSTPSAPEQDLGTSRAVDHRSSAHELTSANIPPIVMGNLRGQREVPLGAAAPIAAKNANHSPSHARRRSWSDSSSRELTQAAPIPHESSQDSDIPRVPSRSPRRTSLHSNARYSTANEGTVELPGHNPNRSGPAISNSDLVSPPLEPHTGPIDSDGIVSPISPDTSLPGTWSNAQAQELGMVPAGAAAKFSSQESTAIDSTPLHSNSASDSSTHSKERSSGLVSAIQRIFNAQKQNWQDEENANMAPSRRSVGDRNVPAPVNVYDDTDERRFSTVPHRKPAPIRTNVHRSHSSELNRDKDGTHFKDNDLSSPIRTQASPRKSGDSARSLPLSGGRYYARVSSLGEEERLLAPALAAGNAGGHKMNMNTARPRSISHSRPGYGIGSGDPFDLARVRTDSSMTGVSLSNYIEPTANAPAVSGAMAARPRSFRSPSTSNAYREPSLAELKREVEEEDRQRRASWNRSRRSSAGPGWRSGVEGQRYGDDSELFDLAVPGVEQFDHFYGQGHGQRGFGLPRQGRRGSGVGVGRAY